ncbi:MAG: MFS transporter, partial [Thermomicrobiales bacterium]
MSQSAAPASSLNISSADHELDGLPIPRRHIAMFAILASIIMAVLDGSIVNIALPTIATDLGSSNADTVWVVNAYAVSLVVSLIPLAALSESIGYRKVFVSGVVLFTVASV